MLYRSKRQWVARFVENRKVLDLGCVEHSLGNVQGPDWLHAVIAKRAKSVLGVDILRHEIDVLKQRGYNVVCTDVETMDLGEQFEVIVAGDLLEHLSNPGAFLDRVARHLMPDGLFLITTPNPVTSIRVLKQILVGRMGVNREHTCWFTPEVISELARRSHLQVVDMAYVDDLYQNYRGRYLWWPWLAANYLACRICPRVSETFAFVLKHQP